MVRTELRIVLATLATFAVLAGVAVCIHGAQASDAQLAGERLWIAASVATDYFELRRADVDIDLLSNNSRSMPTCWT